MAFMTDTGLSDISDKARPVRWWLYGAAFLVFCLVIVGGATRLTESGLSITVWAPVTGILPPLNFEQWQSEFDAYRRIPEYQKINRGMSIDAFKVIYYWEWGHRLLARAYGLVLALGLVWFFVTGRMRSLAQLEGRTTHLTLKLILIGVLSGLQAFIGWWMVASGLVDRVDVSQYRLATHLGAAMILFGALLWVARSLTPTKGLEKVAARNLYIIFASLLIFLSFCQIILGAFVAGTDAVYVSFDWPLMDGKFIPTGLYELSPFWLNWFENLITIQFNHRMLAYLLVGMASFFVYFLLRSQAPKRIKRGGVVLLTLVYLQVVLGIAVLFSQMHLHTALTHQMIGAVFFGFLVLFQCDLRRYRA